MSGPLVSVIVVNYNAGEILGECLRSIVTQDFLRADRDVMVVDNASSDTSIDGIRHYRGLRIIEKDRNVGFAAAVDFAAEVVEGEYIAVINPDARLEPTWLSKMVEGLQEAKAECATSRVDSWDGEKTVYEGGVVSFLGHCWEDSPRGKRRRRYLLFPHGAAMLVRRQTFLDVGGFDPDYFAYFEDVDLGWRMNLLGHRVALIPEVAAYHKGHGCAGAVSYAQRLLLYERNALMTIYKNYDDDNLRRILPAAILLTLGRAFERANLDVGDYSLESKAELDPEDIPRLATATFQAVDEFTERLDELADRRQSIQERRKRSDEEILGLFGDPFRFHEMGKSYKEAFDGAVDLFGVREVFPS